LWAGDGAGLHPVSDRKKYGTMNKKKADVCPDLTIGYDNISSKIERRRYYEYRPIKSTIS